MLKNTLSLNKNKNTLLEQKIYEFETSFHLEHSNFKTPIFFKFLINPFLYTHLFSSLTKPFAFSSIFFFYSYNTVFFKKISIIFHNLAFIFRKFFKNKFLSQPFLSFLQINNFLFLNKFIGLKKKYTFLSSTSTISNNISFFNNSQILNKSYNISKQINKTSFFFLKLNYSKIVNLIGKHRIGVPKRFKEVKKLQLSKYISYKKLLEPINFKSRSIFFKNNVFQIIKIKLFLRKNMKYSILNEILFKQIPSLHSKYKNFNFNKHPLRHADVLNDNNLFINESDFCFNKLEFFFLKKISRFFLISPIFFIPDTFLNDSNSEIQNDSLIFKNYLLKNEPYRFFLNNKTPLTFNYYIKNLFSIFYNRFLFKFFYLYTVLPTKNLFNFNFSKTSLFFKQFYFYSVHNDFFFNNFNKNINFIFLLKKKIIKTFDYKKFNVAALPWYSNTLVRFLEHCTGKHVLLKFFFFIGNFLTFYERTRCIIWAQKLQNFQKTIGNGFFLTESIQIIYLAIKIKDPFFLINWMKEVFNKISFWKYKMFFHYLKYLFKYFFWSVFSELNIKGLKFKLKGKVSVAGNARTRSVIYQIGHVSHSTYDNKILHAFDLVKTFTGVIGLQIWMVF